MTSYARGARFEREIKEILKNKGFFVVRAASSKPIDLISIKKGKTFIIECKTDWKKVSRKVIQEMKDLSSKIGVSALIATKKDGKIIFIDPKTQKEVEI